MSGIMYFSKAGRVYKGHTHRVCGNGTPKVDISGPLGYFLF